MTIVIERAKALMNEPQVALWQQAEALHKLAEKFAEGAQFRDYYDAAADIYVAADRVGDAMDSAWAPDTTGNGPRRPEDVRWAPWAAVEHWILKEASGTGSARVLAVSYLAHAMGIGLDHEESAGGVLDSQRKPLLKNMLVFRRPPVLPSRFWRIFVNYHRALHRELEMQGRIPEGARS